MGLVPFQRLESAAPRELRSLSGRPPGGRNGSVGDIKERGAKRRSRSSAGQLRSRSSGNELTHTQRFKQRQGNARPGSAKERATVESCKCAFSGHKEAPIKLLTEI